MALKVGDNVRKVSEGKPFGKVHTITQKLRVTGLQGKGAGTSVIVYTITGSTDRFQASALRKVK